MKVLLFDPRRYKSFRPNTAPLGLMSIATYLNANGHKAVICDRGNTKERIDSIIKENKPDIIGVSVITYSAIKDALKIVESAKKADRKGYSAHHNCVVFKRAEAFLLKQLQCCL